MLRYLWSLPKASWKGPQCAGAWAALDALVLVQQRPQLHDGRVVARLAALVFAAGCLIYLAGLAVVCLVERLPGVWQHWPGRLRKALSRAHAQNSSERRELHNRSRFS